MSLYETLGVPKDASQSDIKKAYRKKASQNHPDKGGDHTTFVAVQTAYDVLGDEERRARYDASGETGQNQGPSPYEVIAKVFAEHASDADVEHENVLKSVRDQFKAELDTARMNVSALRKQAKRWKQVAKRIQVDDDGPNPVAVMAKQTRKSVCERYLQLRKARELLRQCLKLMKHWSYTVDPQPARVTPASNLDALLRARYATGYGGKPDWFMGR